MSGTTKKSFVWEKIRKWTMPLYFDNYYNINQNDFRYEYPSVIKIVIFCQKDWNKDGTNPCVFARKIGILTNLIFKVLFILK